MFAVADLARRRRECDVRRNRLIGAANPAGLVACAWSDSRERLRVLPDIPPIGDAVPGYAVTGLLGIGAPKGTPPEVTDRLN